MSRLKYFLISISVLVFFGCDTYGTYEYYIDNKSDSELTVSHKWIDSLDSKLIPPRSAVIIRSFGTNNGLSDLKYFFLKRYFDTIYISHNGSIIVKDINKRYNWSYVADEEKYSNIYTFTVENKDLK